MNVQVSRQRVVGAMVARVSPITFKSKWYQDKVEGSSPLLLAFFASFLSMVETSKMFWE